MRKSKKLIIFILVLMISIGFATVSSLIYYEGRALLKGGTLKVQFDDGSFRYTEGEGNVIISNYEFSEDKTGMEFWMDDMNPGDKLSFEIMVRNNGTRDAMLNEYSFTSSNEAVSSFANLNVTYADGSSLEQYQLLKVGEVETLRVTIDYLEENELDSTVDTTFNFDLDYALADSNAFDRNLSRFESHDWNTIITNIRDGNTSMYNVGDEKSVAMGSFGTHNVRIVNKSYDTEEGCGSEGFSETACGFVLEFTDILFIERMYQYDDYSVFEGWDNSYLRDYINTTVKAAMPDDLQSALLNTIVVSGHGKDESLSNYVTTDQLYLLAPHEIWEDDSNDPEYGLRANDTGYDFTRQLDYYKGITTSGNHDKVIKKRNGTNYEYWTRAAHNVSYDDYLIVWNDGSWSRCDSDYWDMGVVPAFRIG